MNREQIETTPIGPELDRLVTDIKGWEFFEIEDRPKSAFFTEMEYKHLEKPIAYMNKFGEVCRANKNGFGSYSPSTSIAAAWELKEELLLKSPFGEFQHFCEILAESCEAIQDDYISDSFNLMAYLSPEAITRAYLLAKLEE